MSLRPAVATAGEGLLAVVLAAPAAGGSNVQKHE